MISRNLNDIWMHAYEEWNGQPRVEDGTVHSIDNLIDSGHVDNRQDRFGVVNLDLGRTMTGLPVTNEESAKRMNSS